MVRLENGTVNQYLLHHIINEKIMKYTPAQQNYLTALNNFNAVKRKIDVEMQKYAHLDLSDDENDWEIYDKHLHTFSKKYKSYNLKKALTRAEDALIAWGVSIIDKVLKHPDIKSSYGYSLIRTLQNFSTKIDTKILKYRNQYIELLMKIDYYKIAKELSLTEATDAAYYYISGTSGMTSNGKFTKDKTRWIAFTEDEKQQIETNKAKPYGATKWGVFILTSKF